MTAVQNRRDFIAIAAGAVVLASAADAQEYNRTGHTEGKIILIVSDQASQK